jgi:hypothetical protein
MGIKGYIALNQLMKKKDKIVPKMRYTFWATPEDMAIIWALSEKYDLAAYKVISVALERYAKSFPGSEDLLKKFKKSEYYKKQLSKINKKDENDDSNFE